MSTVIGVFGDRDSAEQAVRKLREKGFGGNEVSVVARGQDGEEGDDESLSMGGDITTGATTGGALGGIVGLLAGVGALAIPGLGPIVAAGPIAAGLSGAIAGGLAGGLVDWGIPSDRAKHYEQEVKGHKVLALVKASPGKADSAAGLLRELGASDVEVH